MLTSEPFDQMSFAAGKKDVSMKVSYIKIGKKDECHQEAPIPRVCVSSRW